MKVQLKPGEPVKFNGERVVGTEDNPAFLTGNEKELRPLVQAGIATEVKEATKKEPTK